MAINKYNIKKWWKMLTGKSVLHVNQDLGKCFSIHEIRGYYNNLTRKVMMEPQLVYNDSLPQTLLPGDVTIVFPVAVFQYALGCYDLYLLTNKDCYLKKFLQLAKWTLQQQDEKGRWANFAYAYPQHPYSAMAQGEAASVLLRGYKETNNPLYLEAAKLSIDFMLTPYEKGGTALYQHDELLLMEYTHLPIVLNGWIFAWWGLYDFVTITKNQGHYHKAMDSSCKTLVKYLPKFSTGYWSKYDLDYRLTSPFYHHLHIAQMKAMYQLTGLKEFNDYANKWEKQENKSWNKCRAFVTKAWQKIVEK